MSIEAFAKLLQMSMLPVVLISAAGLLLLSITNRLGRTIDRSRSLANEMETTDVRNQGDLKEQLRILLRRSELLRLSVSFVAGNILFSSLMALGLFFVVFAGWGIQTLVLIFFFFSMLSLIVAVLFFLLDVSLALKAVRLNIQPHLK